MAVSTVGSTISYLDKAYSYVYSVGANASITVSASDLGFSTPAGYAFMSFTAVATGNGSVVPRNTSTGSIALRNVSSNAVSNATLDVTIRYIKLTVN